LGFYSRKYGTYIHTVCLLLEYDTVFLSVASTILQHRLFDPCSLEYRETIPKPHPLGVNIATALDAR